MASTRTQRIPAAAAKDLASYLDDPLFTALSEPVRVQLIRVLLLDGPADIATLSAHFAQDRSVVSRHLKVLHDADLVTCVRESRRRIYDLNGPAIVEKFEAITRQAKAAIAVCCP
jgi:DNA-binding transcriptional ArsR family regulator